jgi:heterodisulfide reductase subunit A-like polyferredoxin
MTTCCIYAMTVMLSIIVSILTNNQSEITMNDMSAKRKPLAPQVAPVETPTDGVVVVGASFEPNETASTASEGTIPAS